MANQAMIEINERGTEITLITVEGEKICFEIDHLSQAPRAKVVVGEIRAILEAQKQRDEDMKACGYEPLGPGLGYVRKTS